MKKLIIFIAGVMMLTSCGTTGSGAFSGAMFGGMIGSAIGGIIGGPRGSDVGTIVGMATGAVGGAAIEAASERKDQQQAAPYDSEVTDIAESQYIDIRNATFQGEKDDQHIYGGETAKISFEIHNMTGNIVTNLVPMVKETTENKRLAVSPAIMIENLGPHRALRYTAYISAQDNLKRGTAHFQLYIMNGRDVVSNTIEFDMPLE